MCLIEIAQIEFQIVVYRNKTRNTDATPTQQHEAWLHYLIM